MATENRIGEATRKSQMAEAQQCLTDVVHDPVGSVTHAVQEYPVIAACASLALGLIAGAALGAAFAPSRHQSFPQNYSRWSSDMLSNLRQHLPNMG